MLVEWGMRRTPARIFNNTELKTLLIRGAKRSPERLYPNREWDTERWTFIRYFLL